MRSLTYLLIFYLAVPKLFPIPEKTHATEEMTVNPKMKMA